MENYIEDKKKLYNAIIEFLEDSCEQNEEIICKNDFYKLSDIMSNQQIEGDKEEMTLFLQVLKRICDKHHRDQNFIKKINQILFHIKDQINQTLSNFEIFNIFKYNKILLFILLKNEIITISQDIYEVLIHKFGTDAMNFSYFFYPEIEKFAGVNKTENIKNELLLIDPYIFKNFDEKRYEGENDSYICSLIRKDSIDEFIIYVNRKNYLLSSLIPSSIFETNQFLIDNKDTTLIEYAAFFGSIQIFQYLLLNNVQLDASIWFYAIHSQNAEMIHLLEANSILQINYSKCYIESIKCHHHEFANYFDNKYAIQNQYDKYQKEEIISNCIKYHNYAYFQTDVINEHGFFYLNYFNYKKLVNLLMKFKENEIKGKIIS